MLLEINMPLRLHSQPIAIVAADSYAHAEAAARLVAGEYESVDQMPVFSLSDAFANPSLEQDAFQGHCRVGDWVAVGVSEKMPSRETWG